MAPFYVWVSTASRLEPVYFFPLSSQKFLVLILSTSEGWKAKSTLEPLSCFEHGAPGVKLKCCNVNRALFIVHSDLMCLWDLHNWGDFCFFVEEWKFFEGNKTHVFLLPWVTEAKKPKPFYLIEFSLGEFVISIIVSRLKFVQSLLFAFYTASASSPL